MRILIVESEKRLASTMKDMLVQGKYFADVVHDGETGLDYARSDIYDGLIFDFALPITSGIDAIRILREEGITIPILLLHTKAKANDEELYELADKVLLKPFPKEKLLPCVRELLQQQGDANPETLSYGDLTLDLSSNTIQCNDQIISLSAREFELARLLISSQDNIVPKETIFLKIWGYDSEAESNVVEAYVSFLRRKLRQMESEVHLVAVRRKGYHLCLEQEQNEKRKK